MDTMQTAGTNLFAPPGMVTEIMPIPPIEENCHTIPAGPVLFVLESRFLNAAIISEHTAAYGSTLGGDVKADAGASLHVYGAADGLEYLRFDCFEKQPHYHYLRQAEQLNELVMIDQIAADPIELTLFCARNRLPEMLDHAGAKSLAAEVKSHAAAVGKGLDLVEGMIGRLSA